MIVNPISKQRVPLYSKEGKALLKQYIHSYNQHKQASLQLGGSSSEDELSPAERNWETAFNNDPRVIVLRREILDLHRRRRLFREQYLANWFVETPEMRRIRTVYRGFVFDITNRHSRLKRIRRDDYTPYTLQTDSSE